jgi:hypothetical protein
MAGCGAPRQLRPLTDNARRISEDQVSWPTTHDGESAISRSGIARRLRLWGHRLFLPHWHVSSLHQALLAIPCRHIGHRSCEVSCLTQATMQCMWNEWLHSPMTGRCGLACSLDRNIMAETYAAGIPRPDNDTGRRCCRMDYDRCRTRRPRACPSAMPPQPSTA